MDASRRATCYNLALDGVKDIELPSLNDASLPFQNMRGSVGGGVILIAVGAILLSNTLLGIPLDWLAAWWPVAPLGPGHPPARQGAEGAVGGSGGRSEPNPGSGANPPSCSRQVMGADAG